MQTSIPQQRSRALLATLALAFFFAAPFAHGQATPTASASIHFSAFAGATGNFTGIALAKNLSVTAGIDAGFRPVFGLFPSLEVRGTYPVDKGHVDAQRNLVAGLQLARHLGRLQPYGDILVGRGEINYTPPLLDPTGTILYVQTPSTVLSLGAGCDVLLTDRFGFKGDFQFQRYKTPVVASGSAYSKDFTLGLVYQLSFVGLGHGRRF